jgi:hydrogenase maturation protease
MQSRGEHGTAWDPNQMKPLKTLIIGLGNPILRDDGVGPRVAAELENALSGEDRIAVVEANVGGLGLVDMMAGFERVIMVDAVWTVNGKPGRIHRLDAASLETSRHAGPLHDLDLAGALDLWSRLGMALPRQIVLFAVEAEDVTTFSEECTPEVKSAIPVCAEMILREIAAKPDAQPGKAVV